MTNTITVSRKNLIAKLTSIKDDNISIADIAINRQKLLAVLKLQTQTDADILTIGYGKVSWYDRYSPQGSHSTDYRMTDEAKNEPCIQISCNHSTMRFLNKPKVRCGEPKIIPLNFVDHADYTKPILAGIPIDTKELTDAITFAQHCIATEQSRPVLNCMLFDSGNDTLKLVSADGFRLSTIEITAKGIPQDKVLIDQSDIVKLLVFLKSIKPNGKGKAKFYPEVYLSYDYETITFATDDGSIKLVKQSGTFPDYNQLIPKDGTKIECIASDMLQAVKSLSHIAKDDRGSGIIRLAFSKGEPCGKITLTAKSEEVGDTSVECDAIVETDCKVAVNSNYIADFLKQCKDNKVSMKVSTPSSPMVFELDNKVEVIMPMFVQW